MPYGMCHYNLMRTTAAACPVSHYPGTRDAPDERTFGMRLPMIIGSETEFGVTVQNAPTFDAIATSILLVNSYQADQLPKLLWDYEQEDPLADARGFEP